MVTLLFVLLIYSHILHPDYSFLSLLSSQPLSLLPTHSSLSLQKQSGLPGISTKHRMSSCNKNRYPKQAAESEVAPIPSARSPTEMPGFTTTTYCRGSRFPDCQFGLSEPLSTGFLILWVFLWCP